MVTLKDIAIRCGLSVATVSKAMNNMPDISPATVQRVRDAARSMGYMPNSAARSMKTGRSMIIGMLMYLDNEQSVWTHSYSAQIAQSVHLFLEEEGYDLTPVSFKGASRMGGFLNYCRYRNYDGLIIMSGGTQDASLNELTESGFPLVTIDYKIPGHSSVISDNSAGLREMVHYIHSRGHRKIAFIHGNPSTVTTDRVSGFLEACRELDIPVPDGYLTECPYLNIERCRSATEALLTLPDRPTCIIFPDDLAAMGGIEAIKARGLSIPGDISIAGYDGTSIASAMSPALTTCRQDCDSIGYHAAQTLLDAIRNPQSFSPRHLLLPGKLVEGGSVRDLNAP